MSQEMKKFGPYNSHQVMNFLPHRYPFLFVDKIDEVCTPLDANGKCQPVGTTVTGIKNATVNEHYFVGHFPGMPITPGVIMIETMAQMASFAVIPWVKTDANLKVEVPFDLRLAGIDNTRFRRPLLPGDRLVMKAECLKRRGPIWSFKCSGEVDGLLVVESELLASVSVEVK